MTHRAFKFKLHPDPEQELLMRRFCGVVRLVYNLALEQRRDFWRVYRARTGHGLTYEAQASELTELRAQYDWISEIHVTPLQQALRDLDKAYQAFFKGIARYPTPRKKATNNSFRFQGREVQVEDLNFKWSRVRLPKIGWVKFRRTRQMIGTLLSITVSMAAGQWSVSFATETLDEQGRKEKAERLEKARAKRLQRKIEKAALLGEVYVPPRKRGKPQVSPVFDYADRIRSPLKRKEAERLQRITLERASHARAQAIGVDRGVTRSLFLSNGEAYDLPATLKALDRKKRKAQRVVARRKRGSVRYAKACRRVAALSARSARIRNHWQHVVSRDLAKRFGLIVFEDLNIRNMTASAKGTVEEPGTNVAQKAGLNRAILEQGWYGFEVKLAYKLEEYGGILAKVPAHHTSQTCSSCGVVAKESRKSQASFCCIGCGYTANADYNAALNILRRNTAFMTVEGHTIRPDEAVTSIAA